MKDVANIVVFVATRSAEAKRGEQGIVAVDKWPLPYATQCSSDATTETA